MEDNKVQNPKRRGRGTFSYKKNELYSDRLPDDNVVEDAEDEGVCINAERPTNCKPYVFAVINFLYARNHYSSVYLLIYLAIDV